MWTLIAAAVVLVAALAAARTARRRGGRFAELARAARARAREDPRELDRLADEAERAGDLERALRLRFRAGLIRLVRQGAIPPRESLTSGEIRRLLRIRDFDRLARAFDEVVYGGRRAEPADLEDARARWPRVLAEAPAR